METPNERTVPRFCPLKPPRLVGQHRSVPHTMHCSPGIECTPCNSQKFPQAFGGVARATLSFQWMPKLCAGTSEKVSTDVAQGMNVFVHPKGMVKKHRHKKQRRKNHACHPKGERTERGELQMANKISATAPYEARKELK